MLGLHEMLFLRLETLGNGQNEENPNGIIYFMRAFSSEFAQSKNFEPGKNYF